MSTYVCPPFSFSSAWLFARSANLLTVIDPSIYKEDEEFGRDSDTDSVELIIDGTATSHPNNLPDGPLTTLWPQEVKCEMNVIEWRDALTAANLLPQLDDVLNGFINGFHQGIPDHGVGVLRWFTPPNHSSSLLAQPKIKDSFRKELMRGRMFGPFTHEEVARRFSFFRTSPLGAVVNGNGLVCPINDLSFLRRSNSINSVNSYVDKNEFLTTWDNF
jgi:hypothetical protein